MEVLSAFKPRALTSKTTKSALVIFWSGLKVFSEVPLIIPLACSVLIASDAHSCLLPMSSKLLTTGVGVGFVVGIGVGVGLVVGDCDGLCTNHN